MLSTDNLSRDYHTVVVGATDVQGRLFGRRIPVRRFLQNAQKDVPICTCALAWDITEDLGLDMSFAGLHTGWHDFGIRPVLETLRPYPGVAGTAICMADIVDEEGQLLEIAPRTILRRQLERTRGLGYTVLLASELEFYLFRGDVREARLRGFRGLEPTTLVRSDYSIVGQATQEPFINRVWQEMESANIPVYAYQAEYGLGQWEVNLEHAEALEMADRHVIYKAGLKEMALQSGLSATFMAKPVPADMGSSGHFHCSLRADDEPVFPEASGGHQLSDVGRSFLGGLMRHLNDTAIFFGPYVNSYKRHASEDFGGGVNAWGVDNRTVNFRVVGSGDSLHVEHRYAGADANPYLAAAAIVAAGLGGIESGIDPGPPVAGNAYARTDLPRTPKSLGDALKAFRASGFASSVFGKEVVDHYAAHADAEWSGYLKAVTDWEIERAFELA
jgi:glutamine synthetase